MRVLTGLFCVVLSLIVGGAIATHHLEQRERTVLANTSSALKTEMSRQAVVPDEASLHATMQDAITSSPDLDLSIALVDLQHGIKYHYGETASFTAASIAKLLTATFYLYQTESGVTTLNQPISGLSAKTQLEKMLVKSDNNAWHALNFILTHEGLEKYAHAIGLHSYKAEANVLTANDTALLLAKLAGGKLLNNPHTKLLLSYLEQADSRDYIVAGAPQGAVVYHKAGYLSDRLHDAAVIKQGGRSFVLVIFSKTAKGSYNFAEEALLFQRITAAASVVFQLQPVIQGQ